MIHGLNYSREAKRLCALNEYGVLDQPLEEEYQRLVLLASQICQVPISLISLVDADRQWSMALQGLETREIPRNYSACSLAIEQEGLFEIHDLTQDVRFEGNPLVHNSLKPIQYYAGIPLRNTEGYALGTLCVLDHSPRVLNREQAFALQVLAEQVLNLLELRKQTKKAEARAQQLEQKNALIAQQHEELTQAHHTIQEINDNLLSLNNSLESSVRERTHALKKLSKELDTFLYRSSHDLLRPITSLEGLAMIAHSTLQHEEARELFDKVSFTARGMKVLLGKLLQAHYIISARIYSGIIDLPYVLDSIQTEIQERIPAARWNLRLDMERMSNPWVTQGHLVRVILFNLLENAWHYRQRGPEPPRVSVRLYEDQGRVMLEVWDNGSGMREEVQQRAFDMFYRGSEESPGNGLGLYLVAKTAEYLKAEISLQSAFGAGTRFTFAFPKDSAGKKPKTVKRSSSLVSSVALASEL